MKINSTHFLFAVLSVILLTGIGCNLKRAHEIKENRIYHRPPPPPAPVDPGYPNEPGQPGYEAIVRWSEINK